MDIERIRKELTRLDLDGWLLYDFQGINPIACEIAGLKETFLTRRWFCLIRREGPPVWLVSRIERGQFANVQGEVRAYLSWSDLQQQLNGVLNGCKAVAMEYAPDGSIPSISRVDGGTLEMVAAADVELVSSADLIQWCQARWSTHQLATHMEASRHLNTARELAFRFIGESIRDARRITEYDVQQRILSYFGEHNLVTSSPPIVAVGRNAGDPHYQPSEKRTSVIEESDLVLIDLWAKLASPNAVYADITWMGYVGERVPEDLARIFHVVTAARDATVKFIQAAVSEGREIRGYEVDDVARTVIADAGYGDKFIHRTGHSIGTDDHGTAVHFDNFETNDERTVIPDICCSVEPGIYLDLFGMRSEVNIFIGERTAEVTTMPMQYHIVPLLRFDDTTGAR